MEWKKKNIDRFTKDTNRDTRTYNRKINIFRENLNITVNYYVERIKRIIKNEVKQQNDAINVSTINSHACFSLCNGVSISGIHLKQKSSACAYDIWERFLDKRFHVGHPFSGQEKSVLRLSPLLSVLTFIHDMAWKQRYTGF